jgi:hypothetical protein
MRLLVIAGVITASVVLLSKFAAAESRPSTTNPVLCIADSRINERHRKSLNEYAVTFAEELTNGNSDKIYHSFLSQAQSTISEDGNSKFVSFIHTMAPYSNIHVTHSYELDLSRISNPPHVILCGNAAEDGVFVKMLPMEKQIHIEVAVHTINGDWSIFVSLVPRDNSFQVLAYSFSPSAISGRTARDLSRLAREQISRGHAINAALLYRAAESISSRGQNIMPNWKTDLDKEVSAFRAPNELNGDPPYRWHLGDRDVALQNVGVIGIGGNLNLMFSRNMDNWVNDQAVDSDNKHFITEIMKYHPELSDSFKSIIVQAHKVGGTAVLGTVYEYGKGFD